MSKLFSRIAGLTALLLLFAISTQAHAQTDNPFSKLDADNTFGEIITFTGEVSPDVEVTSAKLTFRPTATGQSTVLDAEQQGNSLTASYTIRPQDYIPPFGKIEFWFSAALPDGSQIQSEVATHIYTDNRFEWQTLSQNDIKVSWVEGDQAFGQAVLDAALETNSQFAKYLDLPLPERLRIYVYPSNSALQTALQITNITWASGHADPANQTILVSIPQGFDQQLSIQRQVPHEVTHVRLSRYMGDNYPNLPGWFSEGLASLAEQYTLPEYWQVLQAASQEGTLIPLEDLCGAFPYDTDQAGLAYAEADSFTRYIFDTYGKFGLQSLLEAYTAGHACQAGVDIALDTSLANLEKDWQRQIGASGLSATAASAGAWGILLGLIALGLFGGMVLPKRSRQ